MTIPPSSKHNPIVSFCVFLVATIITDTCDINQGVAFVIASNKNIRCKRQFLSKKLYYQQFFLKKSNSYSSGLKGYSSLCDIVGHFSGRHSRKYVWEEEFYIQNHLTYVELWMQMMNIVVCGKSLRLL